MKLTTTKLTTGFLAALILSASTLTAFAQTSATVNDDLFAGTEIFAKGATDVTEINMGPDTLGMVAGKDKSRAHSMVLNVVRTYTYDKPGMYRIEDVDTFRNKLNTGDWHCSVHTRSLKSGESTDVCNKRRTDDLSESAIITVSPKELTFIHTIRRRSPGDQSELDEGMFLPPLSGLNALPALAMLGPEMLKLNIHTDGITPPETFTFDTNTNINTHISDAEIERNLDKVRSELKGLDTPELDQQLREAIHGGGFLLKLKQSPAPEIKPDAQQPAPETEK